MSLSTTAFDGAGSPEPAADAQDASLVPDTKIFWERYIRTGVGDGSENELVKAYLPLVKTVVGRMAMNLPSHVDQEHLYSAGLVGLLNAIRQFDPHAGASFPTYARVRIRGAIVDELRRMDWAPRSVHAKARRVQTAIQELEQRHGRTPEDSEVAAALKLSSAEYDALLDEIRPATFICLDACLDDSDDASPDGPGRGRRGAAESEVFADPNCKGADETVSRGELSALIAKRIEQLPEFYQTVLGLYYHEGLRVSEIAAITGFCPAHVCQTHTKAILAIRAFVERYERNGSLMGGDNKAAKTSKPQEAQA